MKIKGAIKLEITGTEDEREDIDKVVEGLKNDPNLQACKIKVTTKTSTVQKIR